jgi:cellulase
MLTRTFLATALISAASAHQVLQQLWINNETPGLNVGIRKAPNNSPVKDIKSNDMACNVPVQGAPSVTTVEAKAGDPIKVQWSAIVHPGPITHFLKPVKDAATDTGVGDGWFKIDELDFVNGQWASDVMKANGFIHEFKLPEGIASGQYLVSSHLTVLRYFLTIILAPLRNDRPTQLPSSRRHRNLHGLRTTQSHGLQQRNMWPHYRNSWGIRRKRQEPSHPELLQRLRQDLV